MKRIVLFAALMALILGFNAAAWSGTLTDNPEWTNNEIYEILSTDPVEGAAIGASFGGLGIDNEPHQQLADRTAFLHNQQGIDIGNISALQNFQALFSGAMGLDGYLRLGYADVNKGQSTALIEWGQYPLADVRIPHDETYAVNWPTPFPHGCMIALATNVYASTGGLNTVASVISWNQYGATFVLDVPNGVGTVNEYSNGINWVAIGY